MPKNTVPLSDDERAELERLRADAAARERAAADAAQRAELERLREQKRRAEADAAADERDAYRRERAREMMEPGDDLKMPLAQKIMLLVIALFIGVFVINFIAGGAIG